jgi:hypothetical protein
MENQAIAQNTLLYHLQEYSKVHARSLFIYWIMTIIVLSCTHVIVSTNICAEQKHATRHIAYTVLAKYILYTYNRLR